jgi:hypothetical protein
MNTTLQSRSDQGAGHADRISPMSITMPWPHGLNVLLALALLGGLAACGSPAPEGPVSGPATGSSGTSRASLAVGAPAGQASTQSARLQPTTPQTSLTDARRPSPSDVRAEAEQAQREARQLWLAELRESPDAPVRLHALNLWAQEPDDDLEPLFEALGDDDEAVQARAEEVWEEQLAQAGSVP